MEFIPFRKKVFKIKTRYERSLKLLNDAIEQTYRTFIFDNSELRHKLILEVENGEHVTFHNKEIPHWVEKHIRLI